MVFAESEEAKPGGAEYPHHLVVSVGKQEPFFYLGRHPITSDRLQQELRTSAAKDPDLSLSLQPDTGAPFGQVLKVWDAAKTAGIRSIQVMAKRPGKP